MSDLEERALRRDRGFLVRLVLLLVVGLLAGGYVFAALTSRSTTGCIAETFFGLDAKPSDAGVAGAGAAPPSEGPEAP